jgi:membrane fusion protein (multidrug efflux system)
MHDVAEKVSSRSSEIRPRRRWPAVVIAIVAVIAAVVVLVGIKAMQIGKMMSTPFTMPPTTVSSAVVKEEEWPPVISAVGSISPVQGAVVSSELGGTVAELKFQNGGVAKKGDILVRLAATTEDADLELARSDLLRTRDLAARKVISKAELDAAESRLKQKEGAVEKKEVRAPFDGQLGIRQVNVGQMIKAGDQVVSLQALNPLYIDFSVPQQYVPRLSQGLDVKVTTDAVPGREFIGKLTAVNSAVDQLTRNVALQGTLDNHEGALRPGMFAKVELTMPEKSKVMVIPGSAVSYAPFGDSVYVIEKKKDEKTKKEGLALRQAFIRLGEGRGDFVSVTGGLKPGDTIVSTGVFKLRNGMPVVVNNELAPKPEMNPKPPDT